MLVVVGSQVLVLEGTTVMIRLESSHMRKKMQGVLVRKAEGPINGKVL